MSERRPTNDGGVTEYQYSGPAVHLLMRWEPYKYASKGADIVKSAIDSLELSGKETIVDVGCANGHLLHDLWYSRGHDGQLIGIDPNIHQTDVITDIFEQAGIRPIEFREGRVQELPLPDNLADHTIFNFAMYHIPPEEQLLAVHELKRVTKPGGKIVISTSASGNKPKHRIFEAQLAQHLGISPPRQMNTWFTSARAADFIPRHFSDTHHQKEPLCLSRFAYHHENRV